MTTFVHPFPLQPAIVETGLVDSNNNALVDGLGNMLVITLSIPMPPGSLAQYKLLAKHYINNILLEAGTLIEVPTAAWKPTFQVDPLNSVAIAAFQANGPPNSVPDTYQPPSYEPFEIVPQTFWKNGNLV